MKILVLGGDGYIGWPLAMKLAIQGHEVAIVDSLSKRLWEAELGVQPLFPLETLQNRVKIFAAETGKNIALFVGDISKNHRFIYGVVERFLPEAIVHLAEQPSAPFSMLDREKCVLTSNNNVNGTLNLMFAVQKYCPSSHIVKLGTMGEYGQPNIDIEEGWLDVVHNGRTDRMLYPKKPGSFYHCTKVHDSTNLEFACRSWGLKVTDLHQGVVYGTKTNETIINPKLSTSFHYDATFGTVLNRFCAQAVVGEPLTIYGNGTQTRGYINLIDSLSCLEIACLNPPQAGEFRVFNQFTEQFSIVDLASWVIDAAKTLGLIAKSNNVENPRVEAYDHYYNAKAEALKALGLQPTLLSMEILANMMSDIIPVLTSIDKSQLLPSIKWNQNA